MVVSSLSRPLPLDLALGFVLSLVASASSGAGIEAEVACVEVSTVDLIGCLGVSL
jgi:hypothetical protein